MDSGQLPEPDPPEPPDRPSSPVRPSSSDKSSTPSNFSPSPNLISPKELQSRTLPLFFSILHLLSSPLSVLFTRIIPEGRSKPEIFFKLHCILSQRFLAFYSLSFSSKRSSSCGFVGAWFWVFQ
ncbi:hypothetical protein Bca4012_008004 [Brassica carinata]